MKIAYLTSEYPAPSHTFIRREIAALRAAGAEIETFSVRRPTSTARFSADDRAALAECSYVLGAPLTMLSLALVAVARRPVRSLSTFHTALRHRVPGARALVWATFHFAEALCLARMLERKKIAHLHNHFANSSAIVGLLASRHLRIGFSLTIHGISEFDGPAGALLPEKVRHASFVACVSSFGRAQVMRLVEPSQWPKLFLSRCGLVTSSRPRRTGAAASGRLRFCSVGRLAPEKGQLGLLEALRATLDAGIDAELHLVGDGPLRAALEQSAAALALEGVVRFHGQLADDEVAAVIAESDIFVMSSFMEGLPVVIMEAFSAGVPVIAPAVAGIPELVVHRETGLLYPASDWDALAAAMALLANDPGLSTRIGERGRRKVAEEHEITVAIAPLVERFVPRRHGEARSARSGKQRRVELEAAPLEEQTVTF